MTGRGRAVATAAALVLLAASACAERPGHAPEPARSWAIAIHAGAGTIAKPEDPAEAEVRLLGLRRALEAGRTVLEGGGEALDAVTAVITTLEDDPHFNAGRGAVYDWEGGHRLDASIMRGADHGCGGVAGVTTVRHPILLARLVMERTPHVLLAGEGAERFADVAGVERVENAWFDTEERRRAWEEFRAENAAAEPHGTVGAVARDRTGHLAAATSTGGMTGKRWGRVGDTPIPGAGTWADDATCAVSSTGTGEEYIRNAAAAQVSFAMAFRGASLEEAVHRVIHEVLKPGDGGMIAVDRDGRIVLDFNTTGMYRGAADSTGRFEVAIW